MLPTRAIHPCPTGIRLKAQGSRLKAMCWRQKPLKAKKKERNMEFAFEKLEVWQRAMRLSEEIYKTTKDLPRAEQFGLTAQIRRAAVSVALNISEGKGRYHKKEFVQFLYQARGSLYETVTLLQLAVRLQYINKERYQGLVQIAESVMSKLSGLINSLK
jgi:four helix bundle protein